MPRIAAYLDELDDDPRKAAGALSAYGISAVCLRTVWGRDVLKISDDGCKLLRDIFRELNLKIVTIASSVGIISADGLQSHWPDLERAILLCKYFDCDLLRVGVGTQTKSDKQQEHIRRWVDLVDSRTLDANVVPLLEPTSNSAIKQPAEIVSFLLRHKRWKICYDPVALTSNRAIDPFTAYWVLLKKHTAALDVRDAIPGKSPKAPGNGSCKIDLTISDAVTTNWNGWYCLEPGLGPRYNSIIGKQATFKLAYDAFKAILDRTVSDASKSK